MSMQSDPTSEIPLPIDALLQRNVEATRILHGLLGQIGSRATIETGVVADAVLDALSVLSPIEVTAGE